VQIKQPTNTNLSSSTTYARWYGGMWRDVNFAGYSTATYDIGNCWSRRRWHSGQCSDNKWRRYDMLVFTMLQLDVTSNECWHIAIVTKYTNHWFTVNGSGEGIFVSSENVVSLMLTKTQKQIDKTVTKQTNATCFGCVHFTFLCTRPWDRLVVTSPNDIIVLIVA